MSEATSRPAWAEVDTEAIRHNARVLARMCAPADLCAVVKADGYGLGAVPVARAALDGGATWLAVAVVEEGIALREAGIDAPILLLSEPEPEAVDVAVARGLTLTIYTADGLKAAAAAAQGRPPVPVHVKVDTGMHRVGASSDGALALVRAAARRAGLVVEGLWTHLAVADEADGGDYTSAQLDRFDALRRELAAEGIEPAVVHAANSAGAIAHFRSRHDLVRCGIALCGHAPSGDLAGRADLQPALSLKARVTFVKELAAGERISYGLRYRLEEASTIATVPLGYADGVTRRLSAVGGCVLVGGERRPIAGTVTMDQLMVDCGPGAAVSVGDEVVLIGRQGDASITVEEWAERLDTISYEVLCGIGPRVPRLYL